ncbi:MAG: alanine racemase C-terminal domain-containing protein [Protaetiibacter sp.]
MTRRRGSRSPSLADEASASSRGLQRHALIDLDALAANLRETGADVLDARADAYGHGLVLVAPLAREVGIRTLTVSNEADADVARASRLEVGFGTPPDAADAALAFGLDGVHRPVMTVTGELIAVKRVPEGAGVSYGYTFRTRRSTTLGLVGLGYADGIPRLGSNRAEVAIAGIRYPLVGRIAMDQFVVDLGDEVVPPGTEVVVFGDPERGEPSAREWAAWTERPALALTAGLGDRIRREAR